MVTAVSNHEKGIGNRMIGKLLPLFGAILTLFLYQTTAVTAEETDVKDKSGNLKILTSFSPDFYTPFINAYKKKKPNLVLQILNKKTTAALTEIQRGNIRKFDIFWSSSTDAFAVLKENGKLSRTGYIPRYPPLSSEKIISGDADGYYYNFALSGVGYMWNENVLEDKGITKPVDWVDLTHPRFYGYLAMSSPSRSGTNHLIVENLLQGMGWEKGWQFLLQLSGNFETITARSFSVPDGVASGRFGAGLVIDFLAISKMHSQEEIGYSYGTPVFLIPAGIAVLKNGGNRDEAVAFIDFILSREGQAILLQPSIGRLPVSGALVNSQEKKSHPLADFILNGNTQPYDTELSRSRYQLVNTLFDQLITYRLLERRHIWKRLLKLEETYGRERAETKEVRKRVLELLCQVPVMEKQSLNGRINDIFGESTPIDYREKRRKMIQDWEEFVTVRLEQAELIITKADFELANDQ